MSTVNDAARSSVARTRRYRARQRQGTVAFASTSARLTSRPWSPVPKEASRDPTAIKAAIKAAIEGLMSDVVFELEAERSTRKQQLEKRVTARPCDA